MDTFGKLQPAGKWDDFAGGRWVYMMMLPNAEQTLPRVPKAAEPRERGALSPSPSRDAVAAGVGIPDLAGSPRAAKP